MNLAGVAAVTSIVAVFLSAAAFNESKRQFARNTKLQARIHLLNTDLTITELIQEVQESLSEAQPVDRDLLDKKLDRLDYYIVSTNKFGLSSDLIESEWFEFFGILCSRLREVSFLGSSKTSKYLENTQELCRGVD